jgi:spore germination cell wall hydrolase CwlJ-like protein
VKSNLSVLGGAAKLGFFVSSLTVATLAARLATADVAPSVEQRAQVQALAGKLDGRLSDASLRKLFDADNDPLFTRFDPGAKHAPEFSAVHPFEGGAPNLHMFDFTPSSAQAINAAVPFSLAPNPPARPFILTGAATDKANALTCLTQAVYYEAGFEPGVGQQAVAQVVLNRMRHPIFPHSVCGVVYQGASLKTGCQFSFTCDGSLARKPQPAAWDRARKVAEMALGGYVAKGVGEATHYHTQWVVPWWQPTVSKVAQVGAHIFYRWQGSLGLPGAFTMRYASNERIAATPNSPDLVEPAQVRTDIDGRVHTVIQLADNTPQTTAQTPRERMLALAAKGALGAGFDPATAGPGQAQTIPAPKVEQVALASASDLQAPVHPEVRIAPPPPQMQVRAANLGCMSSNCSRW